MVNLNGMVARTFTEPSKVAEDIEKNPMTKKDFLYVMRNYIRVFLFADIEGQGLAIHQPWHPAPKNYKILLKSSDTEEEKKKTLIHEAGHFKYNLMGFQFKKTEELLDEEVERFYNKYGNFIDLYYKYIFNDSNRSIKKCDKCILSECDINCSDIKNRH